MNTCKNKCDNYRGMLNFIRGIPKFAVADRCNICEVWFPKGKLRTCPCCGHIIRTIKRKSGDNHLTEQEIADKIQAAKDKGWQLVKVDKIKKAMLDYEFDVKYFDDK